MKTETIMIDEIKQNMLNRKKQFAAAGIERSYLSFKDSNLKFPHACCLAFEFGEFYLITTYKHKVIKLDDVLAYSILNKLLKKEYRLLFIYSIKTKGDC
ncbi:hypothetical protein HRF87_05690 [Bacillus sp. CRN 9]|nr:hypothetical protein [Bacillus sp. CRN 9]